VDNPDEEKTIVNIKGVVVQSYDRAKKSAHKNGETMGSWISRAMDQLANLEAGERYIPPANPANPSGNPGANPPPVVRIEVDFREVAAVMVAMKEAGLPVQKRVGALVNGLLYAKLREARGVPEQSKGTLRISHGLTEAEKGKALSQNMESLADAEAQRAVER
jgi:hypothetical protein